MYLLTFVVLVSAILGLYTEIYATQAAKAAAAQTTMAQLLSVWHFGAKNVAGANPLLATGNVGDPNLPNPAAGGCTITCTPSATCTTPIPPMPPACPVYLDTYLPTGYNTAYNWNSILYTPTAGGTRYLITFATPPAGGVTSASIATPPIGITTGQLLHQIFNIKMDTRAYGTVDNSGIFHLGNQITVTLPVEIGAVIPAGSVALLSQI